MRAFISIAVEAMLFFDKLLSVVTLPLKNVKLVPLYNPNDTIVGRGHHYE
tara:strand:- start:208 stop:357 length:150 start_codon:yes stop_codon:yes gene_type:complete